MAHPAKLMATLLMPLILAFICKLLEYKRSAPQQENGFGESSKMDADVGKQRETKLNLSKRLTKEDIPDRTEEGGDGSSTEEQQDAEIKLEMEEEKQRLVRLLVAMLQEPGLWGKLWEQIGQVWKAKEAAEREWEKTLKQLTKIEKRIESWIKQKEERAQMKEKYDLMVVENAQKTIDLQRIKKESQDDRDALRAELETEKQERKNAERVTARQYQLFKNYLLVGVKLFFHMAQVLQNTSFGCTTPGCRLCTPTICSPGHHRRTIEHDFNQDPVYQKCIAQLGLPGNPSDTNKFVLGCVDETFLQIEENAESAEQVTQQQPRSFASMIEKSIETTIIGLIEGSADGENGLLDHFGRNTQISLEGARSLHIEDYVDPIVDDAESSLVLTPTNDGTQANVEEEDTAQFNDENMNESIKSLSESIILSPTAATYCERAMAYLKINQFVKAEEECTEALKIDLFYFEAYARRAVARKERGHGYFEGAMDDVVLALCLEPNNQDMKDLRAQLQQDWGVQAKEEGNAYFKAQNFNEAILCYSKSIDLLPTAATYGNRAMTYFKLGQFIDAESDCTEALMIDALYFKARARRAMARRELGHGVGALEDVEKALELEPNSQDMKELCDQLQHMIVEGKQRAN